VAVAIPLEVSDITVPWLADVLGWPVSGIEVLDAQSGTTGRARVGLVRDDGELPPSVFVKLAPVASNASGATFPGQRDPGLLAFVGNAVDSFATLHAAFWQSERFAATGDLAWVADRSAEYGSSADLIGFAVDQLGNQLPEASRELADVYVVRAERVPGLLARGPRSLVHGDAHLGNMFSDGATPGFLDWALVGFAPGLRDVAYFLGGSVPTELRREHERRLIERYCLRLEENSITLDLDDAWDQYRIQLLTAWMAAVFTAGMGSKLQSIEVGRSSTLRADAAIRDHDVAALLRDRLP
jgi:phosphotransferase family enzyme